MLRVADHALPVPHRAARHEEVHVACHQLGEAEHAPRRLQLRVAVHRLAHLRHVHALAGGGAHDAVATQHVGAVVTGAAPAEMQLRRRTLQL